MISTRFSRVVRRPEPSSCDQHQHLGPRTDELCACDGTPLFSGELSESAVNFLGFVSNTPIAFLRVTPIWPTNTTIFIDTLTFGFVGAPGACLPSGPVAAACTMRNGNNFNPTDYTCTHLPVVGSVWRSRIAAATAGTTLLTAVLYSLGGALATPVPCESLMPYCTGLEVLNGSPYLSVLDVTGVYDVFVPCAVDLLGTMVTSQGLRLERRAATDFLVPLNALDATVGF